MSSSLYAWVARAVVLFTAMPIHECAHGFVAARLGDDTPKKQGRLTLNPFMHLDLLGSILLIFTGFGWAKPVRVDPRNFKSPRGGMALTSLAGPLSNILLALFVMIIYKGLWVLAPAYRYSNIFFGIMTLLNTMISINLYLAVFNLLPIPPLDGAKIFGVLLPEHLYFGVMRYERYLTLILFVLIYARVLTEPLAYLADQVLFFLDYITRPIEWLLW